MLFSSAGRSLAPRQAPPRQFKGRTSGPLAPIATTAAARATAVGGDMTRVLIVADIRLYRESVAHVLNAHDEFTVVGAESQDVTPLNGSMRQRRT